MLDELARRQRLADAEADALPAVRAALPVERCARALAVAPLEPGCAPVLRRAVATAVDELHELRVGHRRAVDHEGLHFDLVRLELVVVRPRLVLGAEHERPAGDVDLVGPGRRSVGVGRRRDGIRATGAKLQCLEHRLLGGELVLDHEAECVPAADERARAVEVDVLEQVDRALADVGGIRANGLCAESRKPGSRFVARAGAPRRRRGARPGSGERRRRSGESRAPRSTRCAPGSTRGAARAARSARRARRPRSAGGPRQCRLACAP